MKNLIRTTIAFDEETAKIFEELKHEGVSQSEIIRRALRFYYSFKDFEYHEIEKLKIYVEMLAEGEHVILDLDHLVSFLRLIETHPEKEKFWELHTNIAKNHAEEFRNMDIDRILKKLETCNFFRLRRSGKDYTLVFGDKHVKKFMKTFLKEVLKELGRDVEVKENLTKLWIRI